LRAAFLFCLRLPFGKLKNRAALFIEMVAAFAPGVKGATTKADEVPGRRN
jgi:hypothetical protein